MAWVPLHVYSQYSVLQASGSVEDLVTAAASEGCPALALTDKGNMFGAVEFYKACRAKGIAPVIGCELAMAPFSAKDKNKVPGHPSGYPIVLLVKNKAGYRNLCKLSSFAHLEGFYYTPRIDWDYLEKFSEGLICLTGSLESFIGSQIVRDREEELLKELDRLQRVFGNNLYFELQRQEGENAVLAKDALRIEPWILQKQEELLRDQEKIVGRLLQISSEKGIPCVATNPVRYIHRDDWKAQEILMNIQSGESLEIAERDSAGNIKGKVPNPKREVLYSREYYFKSEAEMLRLFSDIPEVVGRSEEVARECLFEFDFKTKYYPVFVPPSLEGKVFDSTLRAEEAEKFLRELCEAGIISRYTEERLLEVEKQYPGKDPRSVVRERLDYELEIITSKGMGDYLLIVYDFINWAKRQGIPVGPGRGSGAGSIILYLIGITDIEPLRFSLFFERFINPERISYPDIDVDICMERRQEVIDYTVRKYGKDKVAQIITFGTMKAKMALKDVGRVLGVPLAKVNALAKLVPEDPTITLTKALEIDSDLRSQYESDPEVQELFTFAMRLEGSVRNTGIHAAGLIIGAESLTENIPLCSPKESDMVVTQFSMKPVESVGLLKIDFLGLKTLTSVQKAVNAVEKTRKQKLRWNDLPLNDKATFDLLNQGKTQGIFQLESGGMQELVRNLHIDKFEEIIAVGALYRPGPMEMIPSFIERKHGRESIDIDHPYMADILAETYGIMVYQEQVMQIAGKIAGYSPGEGDVLRRAMGKKDKEEMAKQREKFRKGACDNGIDPDLSMKIFDKIEKFASYGFNKSHAAAYGYVTYVTAYLKANYPGEWMAALMTSDRDDVTKVARLIRESRSNDIPVLPPDINESGEEFTATSEGIRFALGAIKGVGSGVVQSILEERNRGGYFSSLYDFVRRSEIKKIGKKTVEHLIEAGCFDCTGWDRGASLAVLDSMISFVAKEQKDAALGFLDFFALIDDGREALFEKPPETYVPLAKRQVLKREYELLGFYLKEHPLDEFRGLFPAYSCCPFSQFGRAEKISVCRIACIIETVAVKISAKTQKKFAILTVSDGIEQYELPVWSDVYEQHHSLLVETALIYAVVQVENRGGEIKLQCRWLADLTSVTDSVIKACDEAYEKSRAMAQLAELKEKRQTFASAPPPSPPKKVAEFSVTLDLFRLKLSHVLELKHLFRQHAGESPVNIRFVAKSERKGTLKIPSDWGVKPSAVLEIALKNIDPVIAIE